MALSLRRAGTLAALYLTVVQIALASPALAHEDHNKLGAGPGPGIEERALGNVATGSETANLHENLAAAHEEAMEHHHDAADAQRTPGHRLVSWLGRLHTVIVHFPIAMFIGAFIVELYGLWRRDRDYRKTAQVMLAVGAVGAVVAAFLGWFAGGFYLTDRNLVLMVHRWLGTGIAAFGIALLYLAGMAGRSPERPRTIYWVVLALMTVAIAVQGFLGGTFMHGGMAHLNF